MLVKPTAGGQSDSSVRLSCFLCLDFGHYTCCMIEPSAYELDAWRDIQRFKGRPISRVIENVSEQVANGASELGKRATQYLEKHPGAVSVVSHGQKIVAKSASVVGTGARKAAETFPDWGHTSMGSVSQMGARASRVGLTPEWVLKNHKKKGHDVASLYDVRRLDLEQVDAVRGRGSRSLYYPLAAAVSGGAAGLVISGGELAIPISGGAAAAPSISAIAGALVADGAVVLGLASRSVGHVALLYGYDPEEPGEKMFVMSVVNAGTAISTSAKTAAMADISKLTQALYRGKAWAVLDKSIVAQVTKRFAERFVDRLTKKGLGKFVPGIGIVLGGGLNWATLEKIIDVADNEYRRRFLLEKYPFLAAGEAPAAIPDAGQDRTDEADEVFSVLDELAEAGGPDLG